MHSLFNLELPLYLCAPLTPGDSILIASRGVQKNSKGMTCPKACLPVFLNEMHCFDGVKIFYLHMQYWILQAAIKILFKLLKQAPFLKLVKNTNYSRNNTKPIPVWNSQSSIIMRLVFRVWWESLTESKFETLPYTNVLGQSHVKKSKPFMYYYSCEIRVSYTISLVCEAAAN